MLSIMMVLVMAAAPSLVFAASPWTTETTYHEKAVGKFKFGFKNTFAGWTQIFTQTQSCCEKEEGKACCKFLKGLGKGIVYGVADTAGGVLHMATFLLPQIDIPLPENGVQL